MENVTCEFSQDTITIITGVSGCGKSTLMYLLAGIYPKNGGFLKGGTICVEGENPSALLPAERCKLVGMMFQNPELQFCMDTVRNELIFCLENAMTDPKDMEERMEEALAFCGIPYLMNQTLASLSGGEKQKVMLACLVMQRPKWLLLDEPFANIDDTSAREIALGLVRLHKEYGVGILAVDHRLENWKDTKAQILRMEAGCITDEVMQIAALDAQHLEELGIIVPDGSYPGIAKKKEEGAPVLELCHISVKRDKKHVLKDANARFFPGNIYGIVGESGCGKSSLFGAVSGLYPFEGEMRLEGQTYLPKKKKQLTRIGFVTQSPQDQFVADTVGEEILVSLGKQKDAKALCETILRGIKLWKYRDISAYLLSQGQQRRLGVAALMAYQCGLLICDEPTYAQDRNHTIAIMDRLCAMAREQKVALIFSTHDPALARDYADKIFELKGGCLYEKNESCC